MNYCKHCETQNLKELKSFQFHDVYECGSCNRLTYGKTETCCKNPLDVYVFKYNGHVVTGVYIQCANCGGCMNMTKPLGLKHSGNLAKGEFSVDRLKEWKANKAEEQIQIFIYDRCIKESKLPFQQYQAYLQSEHWSNLRLKVLERDKWLCQSCMQKKATEVHHFSYENLWNERLDELISYCRSCHEQTHRINPMPTYKATEIPRN